MFNPSLLHRLRHPQLRLLQLFLQPSAVAAALSARVQAAVEGREAQAQEALAEQVQVARAARWVAQQVVVLQALPPVCQDAVAVAHSQRAMRTPSQSMPARLPWRQ